MYGSFYIHGMEVVVTGLPPYVEQSYARDWLLLKYLGHGWLRTRLLIKNPFP